MDIFIKYKLDIRGAIDFIRNTIIPETFTSLEKEDISLMEDKKVFEFVKLEYTLSTLCMELGYALPKGKISVADPFTLLEEFIVTVEELLKNRDLVTSIEEIDLAYGLYRFFGRQDTGVDKLIYQLNFEEEQDEIQEILDFEKLKLEAKSNYLNKVDKTKGYIQNYEQLQEILRKLGLS